MKKYLIGMSIATYVEYEIEAESEQEARDKAYDNADILDIDDWDYTIEEISEINN
jgi:hypothetical protein